MFGDDDKTTRWWWVRHAVVRANKGRMYGASDPPAEIDDHEAFAGLARTLPQGARWITSHLQRARQTAHALAGAGMDIGDPTIEQSFGEQSFGEWQGQLYETVAEIAAPYRHPTWFITADHTPPGGESFLDVVARVSGAIDRLTVDHGPGDIVAVAHGGSIRAAVCHALGLDPDQALYLSFDNLSLTRIDHAEGAARGRVIHANNCPRWPV